MSSTGKKKNNRSKRITFKSEPTQEEELTTNRLPTAKTKTSRTPRVNHKEPTVQPRRNVDVKAVKIKISKPDDTFSEDNTIDGSDVAGEVKDQNNTDKLTSDNTETEHDDPRIRVVEWFVHKGIGDLLREFDLLRATKPKVPKPITFFSSNMTKNRYTDVTCLDISRIILKDREENDYIHANKVWAGKESQKFICTQGPLPGTCEDFWWMMMQEKVNVIVMLCDFVELQKKKCHVYYPTKKGEAIKFGSFKVKCRETKLAEIGNCIESVLEVTKSNGKSLTLTHFKMPDWPDHGAPSDPVVVLRLLQISKRLAKRSVVVHCSAGIGRTGTFVGIDYINDKIKAAAEKRSIAELVQDLRCQRGQAIQTASQYVFLHVALMQLVHADNKNLKQQPVHREFVADYQKYLKGLVKRERTPTAVSVPKEEPVKEEPFKEEPASKSAEEQKSEKE